MKEHQVSNHNLQSFIDELQSEINEHKLIIVNSQPISTGKWGLARLWRSWMATTAKFMAENGVTMPLMTEVKSSEASEGLRFHLERAKEFLGFGSSVIVAYGSRPFNADDAHELFTRQHLGVDENGRRLSWAKSIKPENKDKERAATKGERFNALRKHENWCIDRGITLFKPRDSEYNKLTEQQSE